ncbi:MAG: dihydrofolate reductase [Firmicutes bacterium]|nr:dihydrofolate reductase [Bacillota bacterium]
MNLIVVVDENWGIGSGNDLLFHLPEDFKYFKEKTLNKVVVMGGNTLLSLPKSQPLPNRINIVLSDLFKRDDCLVVESLEELFTELKKYPAEDIFIIGGAMFYKTMLNYCDTAFVTKVNTTAPATHFFPNLNELKNWQLFSESEPIPSGGYQIKFTVYKNSEVLKSL